MEAIVKKIVKALVIITLVGVFFLPTEMFSQGPPPWAPAKGYRAKTRHIYFADHNFYYDIHTKNYIFLNGKNWELSIELPKIFVGINLSTSRQIELDYVGNTPYIYNETHKVKYKKIKLHKIKKAKKAKKHRN